MLARKVLQGRRTAKRPRGRPRTRWRDYISDLIWSRLGVEPVEPPDTENREVFQFLPGLLPRDPPQRKTLHENEWMASDIFVSSLNIAGAIFLRSKHVSSQLFAQLLFIFLLQCNPSCAWWWNIEVCENYIQSRLKVLGSNRCVEIIVQKATMHFVILSRKLPFCCLYVSTIFQRSKFHIFL